MKNISCILLTSFFVTLQFSLYSQNQNSLILNSNVDIPIICGLNCIWSAVLPDNLILPSAFDAAGKNWIRTSAGLCILNENDSIEGDKNIHVKENNHVLNLKTPNPFCPGTTLTYELKTREFVTIKIYDLLGKEISYQEFGCQESGVHKFNFDASGFECGIYIYRIFAGSKLIKSKKIIFMK